MVVRQDVRKEHPPTELISLNKKASEKKINPWGDHCNSLDFEMVFAINLFTASIKTLTQRICCNRLWWTVQLRWKIWVIVEESSNWNKVIVNIPWTKLNRNKVKFTINPMMGAKINCPISNTPNIAPYCVGVTPFFSAYKIRIGIFN